MLFKEVLQKYNTELKLVFDKLFNVAQTNQTHNGDLLLVRENGMYTPEVKTWGTPDLIPYGIGHGKEGHSESTQYDFINVMRNQFAQLTYEEHIDNVKYDPENPDKRTKAENAEGLSIQLEMLIYLKIWESDMFIKKLYQLVRLANGEDYDWHFSIQESNRDEESTGNRQVIIRKKIRDRIRNDFPILFDFMKSTYNTQIRNSIAHSKFSFQGRNIHLNNYVKEDPASQLISIGFDEWIERYHKTLLIYNEYMRTITVIHDTYKGIAEVNENVVAFRISREDPEKVIQFEQFKFRNEWNDWRWFR